MVENIYNYIPRSWLCFGSFVVLDVVCGCFVVLVRYENKTNSKRKLVTISLADGHLYGKWLSLVMSLIIIIPWCPFSPEMSWISSGTELNQFLRIFPI